jgi:hypothetical protein
MERADGKAAGDERLYNLPENRGGRWERAPTPYQTRRAVRVVTGPLHRMWQLTLPIHSWPKPHVSSLTG